MDFLQTRLRFFTGRLTRCLTSNGLDSTSPNIEVLAAPNLYFPFVSNISPPNHVRTQITATLSVRDWAKAVEFYKSAFNAIETYRVPGGGVCRLSVDGAEFWVAEESPQHQNFSPQSLGGCSVRMLLIVEDPKLVCERAVAVGAKQIVPVSEEHGWRLGRILDPAGHHWEIGRPV